MMLKVKVIRIYVKDSPRQIATLEAFEGQVTVYKKWHSGRWVDDDETNEEVFGGFATAQALDTKTLREYADEAMADMFPSLGKEQYRFGRATSYEFEKYYGI